MTAQLEEIGFELPDARLHLQVQADRRRHRRRAGMGRRVRELVKARGNE